MRIPLLVQTTAADTAKTGGVQKEVLVLFDQSRTGLLRYLSSMGVRDHDAEEVVQEVFLALFQHLRLGRDRSNLRGWVFRVAHNLGLKLRNASRRTASPEDDSIFHCRADPGPSPEQQVTLRQRQEKLLAVFHALPEQDRCCLHLRSEGLRYREIAETLGMSLGSVAQSLARSLERLHRADGRL
jgi:RNA polymerase sigma-70 factor (ECF subfamily)